MLKIKSMDELKGFGTFNLLGNHLENALKNALQNGANLLDMAESYKNAFKICASINMFALGKSCCFPLTIFYKIWISPGESAVQRIAQFQERILFEHSLIVSAHWPLSTNEDNFRLLDELVNLKQKGIIQGVGLSNYSYEQCMCIFQKYENDIWGLEAEMHPFYNNSSRLNFCIDHEWKFIASSPLYRNLKRDLLLEKIASKYNISSQQLMLLWSKQRGAIPIPCSTNSDHIFSCLNLPKICLTSAEMEAISAIKPVDFRSRVCFEEH